MATAQTTQIGNTHVTDQLLYVGTSHRQTIPAGCELTLVANRFGEDHYDVRQLGELIHSMVTLYHEVNGDYFYYRPIHWPTTIAGMEGVRIVGKINLSKEAEAQGPVEYSVPAKEHSVEIAKNPVIYDFNIIDPQCSDQALMPAWLAVKLLRQLALVPASPEVIIGQFCDDVRKCIHTDNPVEQAVAIAQQFVQMRTLVDNVTTENWDAYSVK